MQAEPRRQARVLDSARWRTDSWGTGAASLRVVTPAKAPELTGGLVRRHSKGAGELAAQPRRHAGARIPLLSPRYPARIVSLGHIVTRESRHAPTI